MNFFRRLFLVLFGLILVTFGVFAVACYVDKTVFPYWINVLNSYYMRAHNLAFVLSFAAALIILGGISLFLGFYYRKVDPLAEILTNDYGPININLSAVDNVIKTTAMQVTGIVSVKTKLKVLPNGLGVFLLVSAEQGINIPEISAELQKSVKDNLEVMVGLKVAEVKVLISSVSQKNTGVRQVKYE